MKTIANEIKSTENEIESTENETNSTENKMKPNSFNVIGDRSLIEYGKLVKAWSLGSKKRPETLDDFEKQLKSEKIEYELSPEIEAIRLHDREDKIFSILLPHKGRLENSYNEESEYAGNGDSYPIPRGYSRLNIDTTKSDTGKIIGYEAVSWDSFDGYKELDDFRVGDYCCSQCG